MKTKAIFSPSTLNLKRKVCKGHEICQYKLNKTSFYVHSVAHLKTVHVNVFKITLTLSYPIMRKNQKIKF